MRESIFHDEWRKSWRLHYPKCHFHKIADMPKSDKSRFLPPKPYDCFALLDGKFYAMELKLKTKIQAFPFKDVTEWQVNNLRESLMAGVLSYVIINYRASKIPERTKKKARLDDNYVNLAFCIDIDRFIHLDKTMKAKSIPFLDLMGSSIIVKKKEGIWEIPELVKETTNAKKEPEEKKKQKVAN